MKLSEEEKAKRPPCPECGSRNLNSKGSNWKCKKCGKWWAKVYHPRRKLSELYPNRPRCPQCGETPYDGGKIWKCPNPKCKVTEWVKTYHPHQLIERPNNPCPYCSSIHVRSQGKHWLCADCGKTWSKYKQERHPSYLPDYGKVLKVERELVL